MMSGTMSWRGGDPGWAALPPGLPVALADADADAPSQGSLPWLTCAPASGKFTVMPAASTLVPPPGVLLPALGAPRAAAGPGLLSPRPAPPGAPLTAAITAATATLTATTPTPTMAGRDPRRTVTRLTVHQL